MTTAGNQEMLLKCCLLLEHVLRQVAQVVKGLLAQKVCNEVSTHILEDRQDCPLCFQ